MKALILHESKGRMRIRLRNKDLTLRQADLLEAWLKTRDWSIDAVVHERTGCAIIYYSGSRQAVVSSLSGFTWAAAEKAVTLSERSTREMNRQFQEKLVGKIACKAFSLLFFPAPIRTAQAIWHMAPIMRKAFGCVRRRELKVELLDAVSVGISMATGDVETASTVMFMLEIGELLEDWTKKKSIADLAESLSLNVDRVWLKTENGEILTPVLNIVPGNRIVVRAGSIVPLDGVIVEGEATVNQSSLTGEAIPVEKRQGGVVYAGTVVEEGECVFEVRQALGQSRYDKIVEMITQSERMKSEAEAKAEHLADRLVPYTFAGSLLSLMLTGNFTKALSVLMVDFSCALKLSMPLAVLSAMREAGKQHITVKGGKFLEAVAKADTIVFDKTGTLTFACPQVVSVVPFGGRDEAEMLRLAACLEEHFPHSMAKSVVAEAQKRGLAHEERHSKVEYIVAHGIASSIEGDLVRIGSSHFIFDDEGTRIPEGEREKFDLLPPEYSHLYLSINGELAAVICISDPLRVEAAEVISALRELGIKNTVMLTGDSARTAAAVADKLAIDDFKAEVLPADKAGYIADLRKKGHTVLMIGDGINDSPALSQADAGIAISHGAAIAREIADITIAADSLWELVRLRKLAMALMRRIDTNYHFVIGFNGALIGLGLAGILQPAGSAILHNLSTLAVSVRSMSALPAENEEIIRDEILASAPSSLPS